jgi:Secretion system C-terminal sorting domain
MEQGGGVSYLLQGLQGRNLTYQWLKNNVVISGATLPDYTVTDSGIYSLVITNDLGLNDTSDVFPFGPLLLNLISFTGQKTSFGGIILQWETSSEQNISGYTIQRVKDNETVFSNIGFVDSKAITGISNNELDYAFTDSSAVNYSKIFYRLQIKHLDGSFTYSSIVLISSDVTKNDYTFFPNPAKGQVQLYLNRYTQPVVMVLYDNTGKKIQQQTIAQQSSTIELPTSKGVYIIQMSNTDGSNKVRKKLLVQ